MAIQRKERAPHSQNRRAAVYAVELINGSEERMCTVAVHTTKEQDTPLAKCRGLLGTMATVCSTYDERIR